MTMCKGEPYSREKRELVREEKGEKEFVDGRALSAVGSVEFIKKESQSHEKRYRGHHRPRLHAKGRQKEHRKKSGAYQGFFDPGLFGRRSPRRGKGKRGRKKNLRGRGRPTSKGKINAGEVLPYRGGGRAEKPLGSNERKRDTVNPHLFSGEEGFAR